MLLLYERQKEGILSRRHEASNQTGTSRQADTPTDHTEQREPHHTLSPDASIYQRQDSYKLFQACLASLEDKSHNEQRNTSRQADPSSSSQSLPEIRQPLAAHHPTEAQHEKHGQEGAYKNEIKKLLYEYIIELRSKKGAIFYKSQIPELLKEGGIDIRNKETLKIIETCTKELYDDAKHKIMKDSYERIKNWATKELIKLNETTQVSRRPGRENQQRRQS